MLTLEVLNDLRPVARGAHFLLSACAGLSVYYAMRRTSSARRMSFSLSAAFAAHCFADYFLRIP